MKTIKTLVKDIQNILVNPHVFNKDNVEQFAKSLADHLVNRLDNNRPSRKGSLVFSKLGEKCDRKLWYSVNQPETREKLTPSTKLKFLYGDLIEHLLLFLAKEAGHTVEGEQGLVEIEGIRGRRDCVIDGTLVDVKSASTMSFKKFDKGLKYDEDDFGYIDQLDHYLEGSKNDPLVKDKEKAAFLVVDKTLGDITLDIKRRRTIDYEANVRAKKRIVESLYIPARGYTDETDGQSGNRKLGVKCGYCEFKKTCWPGLRTFLYSGAHGSKKPRFLTEVKRLPDVPELLIQREQENNDAKRDQDDGNVRHTTEDLRVDESPLSVSG